jgi:RNA polymerase sigma-70 factor (ECF subfamily)
VSDDTALATEYAEARPRLTRMAYAMLGSHSEAEDVVAECWLRLAAANAREPVRDVEPWAVVPVARYALDTLRSARLRRETYVGQWLPEPLLAGAETAPDPADRAPPRKTPRRAPGVSQPQIAWASAVPVKAAPRPAATLPTTLAAA